MIAHDLTWVKCQTNETNILKFQHVLKRILARLIKKEILNGN